MLILSLNFGLSLLLPSRDTVANTFFKSPFACMMKKKLNLAERRNLEISKLAATRFDRNLVRDKLGEVYNLNNALREEVKKGCRIKNLG